MSCSKGVTSPLANQRVEAENVSLAEWNKAWGCIFGAANVGIEHGRTTAEVLEEIERYVRAGES